MSQSFAAHYPARCVAGGTWRRIWRGLRLMHRTWATRRALLEMTPRELSDIGISRAVAITEARRLPWDMAPSPNQACVPPRRAR